MRSTRCSGGLATSSPSRVSSVRLLLAMKIADAERKEIPWHVNVLKCRSRPSKNA